MKSRTTAAIRATGPAAIAVWSALGTGCYRYTPIDPQATPALGTEVRARLTDAGSVSLGPLIGNRIELVDGRLSAVADTAVTLAVTGTTDRLGAETSWRGEQVVFPRAMLTDLERRTLDRGKSWLAGGIAAGIVAVVAIAFSLTGGGGGDKGASPGTPK